MHVSRTVIYSHHRGSRIAAVLVLQPDRPQLEHQQSGATPRRRAVWTEHRGSKRHAPRCTTSLDTTQRSYALRMIAAIQIIQHHVRIFTQACMAVAGDQDGTRSCRLLLATLRLRIARLHTARLASQSSSSSIFSSSKACKAATQWLLWSCLGWSDGVLE